MSHGHGRAKQYGSRAPLGKVKVGDISDEVAQLAATEPGSPEYFDVLRTWAAKLARELRANRVAGSGTTTKQRNDKARKAIRNFLNST